MNKFLRAGASSALIGAFWLGCSGTAAAQVQPVLPAVAKDSEALAAALPAISFKLPAPVALPAVLPKRLAPVAPAGQLLPRGNIHTLPLRPAPAPPASLPGQPLSALVATHGTGPALDAEALCLATAVYFESMGESLEGQLAVAQVVLNRAGSGRYPATLCAVVKQKAQFSFVRSGQFPRIDAGCAAWRKAQAIARIAAGKMAQVIPTDVLWYHADYVAPSWGRRLARVDKIGAHIFYRA
ncbi:MAG: cell wall hydrolase [Sphingomonas sp.]|nr:cell wall hydrolase [Sphingomonas sp.]